MGLFESAAIGSALLLPYIFLAYVAKSGEWDDAITTPPWLADYAREDRRRWNFGLNIAVALTSITLLAYIYGGIL